MRKPLQGVFNIIRFNWHFYVLALGAVLLVLSFRSSFGVALRTLTNVVLTAAIISTIISLLVSAYIYDFSNLYVLSWLDILSHRAGEKIINIHAGFDETSELLSAKYKDSKLMVFDFYDPAKHTEVSIKRARKAYPSFPQTIPVATTSLPLQDHTADHIFAILSAHEIRDESERIAFFKELYRILTPSGKIIVTEHLRDRSNFLAYNIGFFHFHSMNTWLKTFRSAGLKISSEIKITPFITTFILEKNGAAS